VAVVSAQGPWAAPADAKATKNPVKGVGNAKKSVETNCVSCHGPGGKGDGPAAAALPPPKPANWTSAAVQKQTDGELFWKMSNGRGAMPPWKHLPEQERWEIVNYIRTLKGK
jgi:mono/diheme cytochrome c family protein